MRRVDHSSDSLACVEVQSQEHCQVHHRSRGAAHSPWVGRRAALRSPRRSSWTILDVRVLSWRAASPSSPNAPRLTEPNPSAPAKPNRQPTSRRLLIAASPSLLLLQPAVLLLPSVVHRTRPPTFFHTPSYPFHNQRTHQAFTSHPPVPVHLLPPLLHSPPTPAPHTTQSSKSDPSPCGGAITSPPNPHPRIYPHTTQ